SVLGRKVVLDDAPYEVIGVMPRAFLFPNRDTQAWIPMRFEDVDFAERDNNYPRAIGRLRAGVPLASARADLQLVAAHLQRAYPKENARKGINLIPTREEVSEQARLLLVALFGAALC